MHRRRVELNLAQGLALAHITQNRKLFPVDVPHPAFSSHTHEQKYIIKLLNK
jgi:hypothetical protein